jgi:hypothetical protein
MPNYNEVMSQWNWRHGVKFAVAIVVIIYLLKAIYSVKTSHSEINEMAHFLAVQEKDFKEFHQQADSEVKAVQNGMANGAKEFDKKVDDFSKSLDDFAKDFTSSVNAAIKTMDAHEQQRVFDYFVDAHYNYYDEEAYEKERQHELFKSEIIKLPTYKEFVVLREKAFQCGWKSHNDFEETYYKNKIAQLKAENNEAAIANVPKPDLWPWPITSEVKKKIIDQFFPHVISIVRQDGTCIHG